MLEVLRNTLLEGERSTEASAHESRNDDDQVSIRLASWLSKPAWCGSARTHIVCSISEVASPKPGAGSAGW